MKISIKLNYLHNQLQLRRVKMDTWSPKVLELLYIAPLKDTCVSKQVKEEAFCG